MLLLWASWSLLALLWLCFEDQRQCTCSRPMIQHFYSCSDDIEPLLSGVLFASLCLGELSQASHYLPFLSWFKFAKREQWCWLSNAKCFIDKKSQTIDQYSLARFFVAYLCVLNANCVRVSQSSTEWGMRASTVYLAKFVMVAFFIASLPVNLLEGRGLLATV